MQKTFEAHAAALLRISYACKDKEIAEEIRKIAYALELLAKYGRPNEL